MVPAPGSEGEAAEAGFAAGTIRVGAFTESFSAPLGYWDRGAYERSWQRALAVLEESPAATACLMTSMTDPRTSNFLVCWPLFRGGDIVYVQNRFLFLDDVGDIDPEAPWRRIGPRETADEEGTRISEWTTSMSALRHFSRQAS